MKLLKIQSYIVNPDTGEIWLNNAKRETVDKKNFWYGDRFISREEYIDAAIKLNQAYSGHEPSVKLEKAKKVIEKSGSKKKRAPEMIAESEEAVKEIIEEVTGNKVMGMEEAEALASKILEPHMSEVSKAAKDSLFYGSGVYALPKPFPDGQLYTDVLISDRGKRGRRKGHKVSDATLKLMSESKRKQKYSVGGIVYESLEEAAVKTGINRQTLYSRCRKGILGCGIIVV
jgi:hypothetical protein